MSDKINRIIGIAIVVAIIIFCFFWFYKFEIDRQTTGPTQTSVNKIENFKAGQIPIGFPTELPIEIGAKIISSYNATTPDGRVQATQVFESSKSGSANFKIYNDYFIKNNWKILAKDFLNVNLQSIIAQNSRGIISVTIHGVTDKNKSIVDLSFLINK